MLIKSNFVELNSFNNFANVYLNYRLVWLLETSSFIEAKGGMKIYIIYSPKFQMTNRRPMNEFFS